MVSVLVITQVIRVTQNHISLNRQEKEISGLADQIQQSDLDRRKAVDRELSEILPLLRKFLSEAIDGMEELQDIDDVEESLNADDAYPYIGDDSGM